jgi:hypothetical protein
MEVVRPNIKAAAMTEQETEIPDIILKSINTGEIFIRAKSTRRGRHVFFVIIDLSRLESISIDLNRIASDCIADTRREITHPFRPPKNPDQKQF